MSPLVRLAKRYHLTGSRLVIVYALLVITATLVLSLYLVARSAG